MAERSLFRLIIPTEQSERRDPSASLGMTPGPGCPQANTTSFKRLNVSHGRQGSILSWNHPSSRVAYFSVYRRACETCVWKKVKSLNQNTAKRLRVTDHSVALSPDYEIRAYSRKGELLEKTRVRGPSSYPRAPGSP